MAHKPWIFKADFSKDAFLSGGGYSRRYLEQLMEEYEQYLHTPVPPLTEELFSEFARTGRRIGYEREYFRRRSMLRDFALVSWLYGDKTALSRLEEVLGAICHERTWTLPAHITDNEQTIDLFAAETAHALSEIMSLLKNELSDAICARCSDEVLKRVLMPFASRSEPYGWERAESNWSAVCGGCVGMTAIYLARSGAELKRITDGLRPAFGHFLNSFADDGACLEGLDYWNYGVTYFTAFCDLYRQRIVEDYPVPDEKMRKIADFASKCCLGGGYTLSFSDSSEYGRIYSGIIYKLNEIYGASLPPEEYMALFAGDECGRLCRAVRDIAWTRFNADARVEAGNVILPDAQWAVLRSEGMTAALKGGTNGEPHNHNDVGAVTVMKDGEMLICDIGAGEYTRDYFSENRYGIFCNSSAGHSVPVINGCEQKCGKEYRAESFEYADGTVSVDIGGAYGLNVKCRRSLVCSGKRASVTDVFDAAEDITVTERFITRCDAANERGAVKIIKGGITLGSIKTDNSCKINIKRYTHSEHNGEKSIVTAVDFEFAIRNNGEFSVEIL